MKSSARLLIFLIICTLSPQAIKAEDANNSNAGQDSAVAIELTKFDVNDTTLELAWKIVNNTDHDVWICSSLTPESTFFYDVYLDTDTKTLILRRQFNLLLEEGKYISKPFINRYARLCSGQEKNESISLVLPIVQSAVFNNLCADAEFATHLTLKIGFYNEDLPGLILKIVDSAEKLSCDIGLNSPIGDFNDMDVCRRFFGGVFVARFFNLGGFEYFRDSVISGGDEVFIPYMWQNLNGEQVLRLDVDGVSIPIKSINPPLENQDVNEPADSQDIEEPAVSMELTHFEITDANLELGWNIKNNTDHDVWICDSIDTSRPFNFEVFLAEDVQTLVIRRRLDVPAYVAWSRGSPSGRYICLRPGEERPECLSLNLPVLSRFVYGLDKWTTVEKCARCLELDIGFYNQNLPGLVYSILQQAETLISGIDQEAGNEADFDITREYFRGLLVRVGVGSLSYFKKVNKDPYSEGEVLIGYTSQALTGEKVSQINIDGVSIPYQGGVQSAGQ